MLQLRCCLRCESYGSDSGLDASDQSLFFAPAVANHCYQQGSYRHLGGYQQGLQLLLKEPESLLSMTSTIGIPIKLLNEATVSQTRSPAFGLRRTCAYSNAHRTYMANRVAYRATKSPSR